MIKQIGAGSKVLTHDEFESFFDENNQDMNSDIMVLDFSATWCGPCEQMYPYLEKISESLEESNVPIKMYKVDVSNPNNEYCDRFDIESLPTLLFIKNGNTIWKTEGFRKDGSSLVEAFTKISDSCDTDVDLGNLVGSCFEEPSVAQLSA